MRIASAAVHFEPAIEALVPGRRGHPDAESNWLNSVLMAGPWTDRPGCIRGLNAKGNSLVGVMDLMDGGYHHAHKLAWDCACAYSTGNWGSINFRRPGPSRSPDEAIAWMEFTISFMRGAIRCPLELLESIPSTVGGLRWFMREFQLANGEPHDYMPALWRGCLQDAFAEPVLTAFNAYPQPARDTLLARWNVLIAKDRRRIEEFSKGAKDKSL